MEGEKCSEDLFEVANALSKDSFMSHSLLMAPIKRRKCCCLHNM